MSTETITTAALLARLNALHPKKIDLSLGRIERLLAALGNPERKLPPVVHIAGTNGKGSTAAFLRAFAEAAGLRVHVYTSPHLVRFNERIRLAGCEITDEELNTVLEDCEKANGSHAITFFEMTTAAAFLAFSRHRADLVILETGLGGRLDATNVIARPRLSVITQVSLDHQHFLGDDVASIMAEKAGILKAAVVCVAAQQGVRSAAKVLAKQAQDIGAELLCEGRSWFSRVSGARGQSPKMVFKGTQGEREFPMPALAGRHQMRNASLAIACVEALQPEFEISDAAVALGLKTVNWPGRLQHLTQGPLADELSDGWELWLDGGHNAAAAEMLAQHSRTWRDRDLWMIFGALNQRDPGAFLKPFEAKLAGLRVLSIPGQDNSLSAQALGEAALKLGMEAKPMGSVFEAVRDIVSRAAPRGGRILICGSLYLAGHVLGLRNVP